jgi:hypothetical protein
MQLHARHCEHVYRGVPVSQGVSLRCKGGWDFGPKVLQETPAEIPQGLKDSR